MNRNLQQPLFVVGTWLIIATAPFESALAAASGMSPASGLIRPLFAQGNKAVWQVPAVTDIRSIIRAGRPAPTERRQHVKRNGFRKKY